MADVTGARGTLNVNQSQRKVDMAKAILLLEPDAAPLTLFSHELKKRPCVNPEYSWVEDALDPEFTTANGSHNGSVTTIAVAAGTGTYFAQHDLVRVTATGEVFRVTAVATDNLTVVRAVGSTGQTIADGGELLIIGSAQPEGDTSKPARSTNPVKKTNYTQILRTPVESTETQIHSDQFTEPNDWDYQRRKAGIHHARKVERTVIWGHPSEDTSGSQPRRTTGGALHYITTNITSAGGTLTEATFWGWLRTLFRYGSRRKVVFTASKVTQALNQFATGKLQIRQGEDTYGLAVLQYISPFGTIKVINHWLLEGTTAGGQALALDLDQIAYRYLANSKGSRDTHIRENIQAPDSDTQKDEFLSEIGLEFGLEKEHGLLTGVTG